MHVAPFKVFQRLTLMNVEIYDFLKRLYAKSKCFLNLRNSFRFGGKAFTFSVRSAIFYSLCKSGIYVDSAHGIYIDSS